MDKYRGKMFFRGQPMSEIDAASYDRLRDYAGWSDAIRRAELKAYNANKGK